MSASLFDLAGRVALVTGANTGIGQGIALALAEAGADIAAAGRSPADETIGKVRAIGRRGDNFAADLSSVGAVQPLVDAVLAAFGRIDILVNNAGINIRGPIDEVTFEQFQQVQDINVNGPWLCSRAVVPHMKQSKQGRIINLASTLGLVGLANRTPYASSKGAVVQFTKALGLELAPWNITVNAICPGPFLTPMNEPIAETAEAKQFIIGATALGRWGRMEEIQGAAIFLASDAASYVTGSLLTVDGGWTAR